MNMLAPGFRLDSRDPIAMLAHIPAAASRLERLQHQRDDAGAIGQRIEFHKMELRERVGVLDNRVKELTVPRGMGGHGLSADDPSVVSIARERDELRARLKRLDEHGRTTSPTRRTTGQLYGRCERFVLDSRSLAPATEPSLRLNAARPLAMQSNTVANG